MTIDELLAEYAELPEFADCPLSSVNQRGRWDSCPLHIAVHRKRIEEVKTLLEAGANPNAPGEYGERPLQIAIRRQEFHIVELLLKEGARCDLTDKHGQDAWDNAESVGARQKLEELVKKFSRNRRQDGEPRTGIQKKGGKQKKGRI